MQAVLRNLVPATERYDGFVADSIRVRVPNRLLAALYGAISGIIDAYCYQADALLRPVAHSLGLWIFGAVMVAYNRKRDEAVASSVLFLMTAVGVYYALRATIYNNYTIDAPDLAMWSVAAVAMGVVLAVMATSACQEGKKAALAAALIVSLLLCDGLERLTTYNKVDIAQILNVTYIAIFMGYSRKRGWHWGLFACATIMLVPLGLIAVNIPDMLEDLLREVT